jgi:Ca2+-binding EF-hand superfamily protein
LPSDRFEALLEELGEGFHGEEFDVQLAMVDPSGTNEIERQSFISWYCGLLEAGGKGEEELDDDELIERDEERQRVQTIFKMFSEDDGKTIGMDVFSKFMKKIGTTYAEEVHGKAAKEDGETSR